LIRAFLLAGIQFWRRLPEGAAYPLASPSIAKYQNTDYAISLNIINDIFTLIFLVELLLKLCAWGALQ
jgi:hypothetical protein